MKETLEFESNAGITIRADVTPPILLQRITGDSSNPVDVQSTKAPFQDGATFRDALLESRDLFLNGVLLAESKEDFQWWRRRIMRAFNPKVGEGVLTLTREGTIRQIRAIAEETPEFAKGQGRTRGEFMVPLKALDPFWMDPEDNEFTVATFLGGFSFPWSFPLSFGERGDLLTLNNSGDVDCPVFLVFEGPATNPTVTNTTTDEFMRIEQEITADETLEINTAFGEKSATRVDAEGNRHNALHWVDLESTFWQLVPGENVISYQATDEAEGAAVRIYYRRRYVGV